jgi:hypothetical protein
MSIIPRCAEEGCNARGVDQLILHHHRDSPYCHVNCEDENHFTYWLCQHHLDEAIDKYPKSFPEEYVINDT